MVNIMTIFIKVKYNYIFDLIIYLSIVFFYSIIFITMNEIDKESTPQEMPTHTKGVDDWFEYIDALDDWRSSLGR